MMREQLIWTELANHLWQSTLFLLAAAALTLLLRHNQARIRYAVWFAASIKFVLPFSLLIAFGAHLPKPHRFATAPPSISATVQQVSQPFTTVATTAPPVLARSLGKQALTLLWLCGVVAVLARWYRQWKQIAKTLAQAQPMQQGNELQALRAAERSAGLQKTIPLMLSSSTREPGIFGIRRPVLLWPAEISGRLQSQHVAAIVAHEVHHVRRRDNLTAAFHMLVEALFWFHPLVWWLGARLVAERERACDEHVIALGNQPKIYAESILKTCEYCVESPLAFVSGVSGADLKTRILRIMTAPLASHLTPMRKLLLACAVVLAIAVPATFGLLYAPRTSAAAETAASLPEYEVVSIRENKSADQMTTLKTNADGFSGSNLALIDLIRAAYGLDETQLLGAPSWLESERYDVVAKVDVAQVANLRGLTTPQREAMMQPVLRDRLQLKTHWETKQLIVYALVVDKTGLKIHEAMAGDTYATGMKGPDGGAGGPGLVMVRFGQLTSQAIPMSDLSRVLSGQLRGTVVDKTGLTGKYDISLHWQREQSSGPPEADATGPSLFSALQDQLGLKLESQKAPVQVLVIDHVERPSPN